MATVRLNSRHTQLLLFPVVVLVTLMFVLPLIYFLQYSFAVNPRSGVLAQAFTLDNYSRFFQSGYYRHTLFRTLLIALASTALSLLLAMPLAYQISRSSQRVKFLMLIFAVFPLMVGDVIRAIGWVALLGYSGVLNNSLQDLGIIDGPLEVLRTPYAMVVAITSVVLPIMVLTLQASLDSVDTNIERASLSLGVKPFNTFVKAILPQIVPGVVAATSLVFVLCVNAYSTPLLVGGSQVPMLAPEVYASISSDNDWGYGAAMATLLLTISLLVVVLYGWLLRRQLDAWRRAA